MFSAQLEWEPFFSSNLNRFPRLHDNSFVSERRSLLRERSPFRFAAHVFHAENQCTPTAPLSLECSCMCVDVQRGVHTFSCFWGKLPPVPVFTTVTSTQLAMHNNECLHHDTSICNSIFKRMNKRSRNLLPFDC